MSLPSGRHTITNKLRGRPVGLGLVDPGVPLQVFVAPETTPTNTGPRILQIDSAAGDKYRLTFVEGTQRVVGTKPEENLVWAFGSSNQQKPTSDEWKLVHIPQHGENAFLIVTPDNTKGWVAREDDNTQIAVSGLLVLPTNPPRFPDTEIFNIVPVSESDESAQA